MRRFLFFFLVFKICARGVSSQSFGISHSFSHVPSLRFLFLGYGEGAQAALSGGWALKELGVNVQSIHVGATPVNWLTTISKFAGKLYFIAGDATRSNGCYVCLYFFPAR